MDRLDYFCAAFSVSVVVLMGITDFIRQLKTGGFVMAAVYAIFVIYTAWLTWQLAGKAWRNEA